MTNFLTKKTALLLGLASLTGFSFGQEKLSLKSLTPSDTVAVEISSPGKKECDENRQRLLLHLAGTSRFTLDTPDCDVVGDLNTPYHWKTTIKYLKY